MQWIEGWTFFSDKRDWEEFRENRCKGPWPDLKPDRFLLFTFYKGCDYVKSNQEKTTYKLKKIPVKDVVVHITLAVKQIAEKLTQIRVVWFVIKA